jgi:hypothetical protein
MSDLQDDHDDYDEDADDAPPKRVLVTVCDDCDDPLKKPVEATDGDYVTCEYCDPETPPKYWVGALAADGKSIDPHESEQYKRLSDAASDTGDLVHEWHVPRGDTFVSQPDGTIVDAVDWVRQREVSEHIDLAAYEGRGEFDPANPDRVWLGQRLPSGSMYRPNSRAFDSVEEMAQQVVADAANPRRRSSVEMVVMLPGGELVDAKEWADRPETRRLAGATVVRNMVRYTATATCGTCGKRLDQTVERLVQGDVGEEVTVRTPLRCCGQYHDAELRHVTLVDDDSGALGAEPRELDAAADDSDHGALSGTLTGSLDGEDVDGRETRSGSLSDDDRPHDGALAPTPPVVHGNVTGLPAAIAYARDLRTYVTDLAFACAVIPLAAGVAHSLERARADLAKNGLTGTPLALVVAAQDAIVAAFHPIRQALADLDGAAASAANLVPGLEGHIPLAQAHADVNGEGGNRAFFLSE